MSIPLCGSEWVCFSVWECVYLCMNHGESACVSISGKEGVCIFVSEWDVSECVSVCMRVSRSVYPCGSAPLQLGWAQAL